MRAVGAARPAADRAEADGLAEWLGRVADGLAADGLAKVGGDGAAGLVFGPSETPGIEVVGLGVRSAGEVAGLNVATDSIAPATRHTARMLASSGMTVPGPENRPVSRRSRFLRRCARSSRW